MARSSLRGAAAVLARDPASAACAAELGRPVDLLTTDVVFALPTPRVATTRDVIVNVSGLLWLDNPHVDSAAYRACVLDVCTQLLAQGRRLTLLSHVLDSPLADNDVPANREAAALLDDDVEVVVPESLDDARTVLASARIVIAARMHACLNALSGGVPAVPLAYSRKFGPLLEQLGWPVSVDLRTSADPTAEVLAAVADDSLETRVHEVRARADRSLDCAEDALRTALVHR